MGAISAPISSEGISSPTTGLPKLEPSSQQSKRRKLRHSSEAASDMTVEPILRLRGGGADAKRKEVRKRKFGQTQPQVSSTQSAGRQSGTEVVETEDSKKSEQQPKKKQKKHKKALAAQNDDDVKPDPETPATEEGEDLENAEVAEAADAETAAASKPQRFIVFIGTQSPPLPLITNQSPLIPSRRKPPLHSHNSQHNSALLQSATHLCPPPHAQRNKPLKRVRLSRVQRLRSDEDLLEIISSFQL